MLKISEGTMKAFLVMMLLTSVLSFNPLGVMIASFSLYGVKKSDINILKMMYIPLIFNIILLIGLFVVSILVDISLYKTYSDDEKSLSMNVVYLFSISIIIIILVIYQIVLFVTFHYYVKYTLKKKLKSRIPTETSPLTVRSYSPTSTLSSGTLIDTELPHHLNSNNKSNQKNQNKQNKQNYPNYINYTNYLNSAKNNYNSLVPCIPNGPTRG